MDDTVADSTDKKIRRLHIGGKQIKEGWEILNIMSDKGVDHVGDALDLSSFQDETFQEIYASHILEHLDYNGPVQSALKEWRRVLKSGGKLFISVPDLDILSKLFIHNDLSDGEKFFVMRMMFGGHMDKHDYHYSGFNSAILAYLLNEAGFESIKKVNEFGLFHDSSVIKFRDVNISLNIMATKPEKMYGSLK